MVRTIEILKQCIALSIGIICLMFTLFIAFLLCFAATIGYVNNSYKKSGIKVKKLKLNEKDKEIIKEYGKLAANRWGKRC